MIKKFSLILILAFLVACQSEREPIQFSEADLGWIYNREADGMQMVYVPRGTFMMGSQTEFPGAMGKETPYHKVSVSGFWIDKTPVTNAQYALCVEEGSCESPRKTNSWHRENYYENSSYSDYPVVYVNWEDAHVYCQWAGVQLPTEAQWEFAARGSGSATYPWGDSAPEDDLTNWGQPGGDTNSVDNYPKGESWVGALEMAGNVWEWTADWYEDYTEDYVVDPIGPERGRRKVSKGGSFLNGIEGLRSASRNPLLPEYDDNPFVGFRCAGNIKD